jgi:hypothetical protein
MNKMDTNLKYEQTARELIYPDLRKRYKNHERSLKILADALKKVHLLLKAGGGEPQELRSRDSIFDQFSKED